VIQTAVIARKGQELAWQLLHDKELQISNVTTSKTCPPVSLTLTM